jgi:hypothetical protein
MRPALRWRASGELTPDRCTCGGALERKAKSGGREVPDLQADEQTDQGRDGHAASQDRGHQGDHEGADHRRDEREDVAIHAEDGADERSRQGKDHHRACL